MMNRKHLRVSGRIRAALLTMLILIAVGTLLQAKDKGDKDFKAAEAAASTQDWDKALDLYMQALDKNPNNPAYMIGMRRARFQAGQMHVNRGQKLRADGKVQEAMAEFQRAIVADPSSSMAIKELRRTHESINSTKGGAKPANPSEAGLTPFEREKKASDRKVASIEAPPERLSARFRR